MFAKEIIFFANLNGFIALSGLPISSQNNSNLRDKTEVDFLVFHSQKCMIFEVDGLYHNEAFYRNWDSKRDKVFLRQGIPTVRFSAQQCYENSSAVV